MDIDPYAKRLARYKARQLIRRPEFANSEREDIEHDLLLDLLERLPHYDPERASSHTFIARIIDHKVASMLEHRSAAKPDPRRLECSLNTPVRGEYGVPTELGALMEGQASPSVEASDLGMDIQALLEELPPKLRAVAERLPRSTIREIAEELGVHRRTIHRWKKEIRRRGADMGLDDYLRKEF